jgi:hypothetical protein
MAELPERVLIVVNCARPPVGEALAAALARLGVQTRIFFSQTCNTLYDRLIIHTINHYAHTLRLVPKTVDLFEGHPQSHKEYRNREFLKVFYEFQPDLVFLTRGLRFKLETLREIQQRSTVFCWFTESEKRVQEIAPEMPFYHHTYFFSSLSLEIARQLGFANVSLLQHAVDTSQFYSMDLPQVYDWCFVGQWHERRQQYIEGLAEVSPNFVIYGSRWRKRLWRRPDLWLKVKGNGVWDEALTRLYNQTKVVINVSVWAGEQQPAGGVNLRLLEVPACRTCLLTDYAEDAAWLLVPEKEFVSAASLPEMQAKLAELLADEPKRRQIAQAGYEKAAAIRTYDHLVAEVLVDWAHLRR